MGSLKIGYTRKMVKADEKSWSKGRIPYCWTNPDQPFSFLPQPPDSLPAVSLDLLRPGTKVAVAEWTSGRHHLRRSLNIKLLKEKRKWIHRSSWTILDHKKTYCTIIIKSSSYSRLLSELNCPVMSSIVWLQPPVVYYGLLLKGLSAAFEARASYASWRSRHLLSEENGKTQPASAGSQVAVGLGSTLQAGPKPEIVGPNWATGVPQLLQNEWLRWHILNDDYHIL